MFFALFKCVHHMTPGQPTALSVPTREEVVPLKPRGARAQHHLTWAAGETQGP